MIPVRPGFLPGHSRLWIDITNQALICSFLLSQGGCAHTWQILSVSCVHRENGSSRTAAHPRSPTLHLSTLGFQCFNKQLMDTSFPHGGGRFAMVEVSTMFWGEPQLPRQNQTLSCSRMHRTSAGEHIGMHCWCPVYRQQPRKLHSNALELEAIHRTMLHWLRKLMGLTVLVASDNSSVASYINNQDGTRLIHLCRRTEKLRLMCQANIPGRLNVLADILSRLSHMSGTIWSLHLRVFQPQNVESLFWICLQRGGIAYFHYLCPLFQIHQPRQ